MDNGQIYSYNFYNGDNYDMDTLKTYVNHQTESLTNQINQNDFDESKETYEEYKIHKNNGKGQLTRKNQSILNLLQILCLHIM